jgi:hypothetical protein
MLMSLQLLKLIAEKTADALWPMSLMPHDVVDVV